MTAKKKAATRAKKTATKKCVGSVRAPRLEWTAGQFYDALDDGIKSDPFSQAYDAMLQRELQSWTFDKGTASPADLYKVIAEMDNFPLVEDSIRRVGFLLACQTIGGILKGGAR